MVIIIFFWILTNRICRNDRFFLFLLIGFYFSAQGKLFFDTGIVPTDLFFFKFQNLTVQKLISGHSFQKKKFSGLIEFFLFGSYAYFYAFENILDILKGYFEKEECYPTFFVDIFSVMFLLFLDYRLKYCAKFLFTYLGCPVDHRSSFLRLGNV